MNMASEHREHTWVIGVLSDTHLSATSERYQQTAREQFAAADIILHAGDLTDLSVLEVFADKKVFAVCGNMCSMATARVLPASRIIEVNGFRIGLCHGAGAYHNIEERLWDMFAPIDCIVYGHTHQPVCHRRGPVLFVNPGSFFPTGRRGAPGTCAMITVGRTLTAAIHEVEEK